MGRCFSLGVTTAAMLMLAQPQLAYGQSAALQRRLAAAERLDCSFSALATGNWDGGTPGAEATPANLEVAFFDINVDEGSAEAEGTFGATFISARYSQGYLHLMQVSDAGPLYVTSVFARELAPGRLLATHVRLEYAPVVLPGFTSRPEMYVGSCSLGGD